MILVNPRVRDSLKMEEKEQDLKRSLKASVFVGSDEYLVKRTIRQDEIENATLTHYNTMLTDILANIEGENLSKRNFGVYYQDDEGDEILMNSLSDWAEAWSLYSDRPLKLVVRVRSTTKALAAPADLRGGSAPAAPKSNSKTRWKQRQEKKLKEQKAAVGQTKLAFASIDQENYEAQRKAALQVQAPPRKKPKIIQPKQVVLMPLCVVIIVHRRCRLGWLQLRRL